ncbi:MAG: hypothetical protein KAY24_09205 [Candidatus Eisenbacteria sp.]|nr:hypothetical protein [Candidatus Eisenbacteria bacterium]
MTFEKLVAQRKLVAEPTGRDEIEGLRALVRRSIADSAIEALSADGRFERAYSAARALATMVVRAAGYRVRQPGGHYNTFLGLEAADPQAFSSYAAYFDKCRVLRNVISYEAADVISEAELEEILGKVPELEAIVESWLSKNHPGLA